MSCLSVIPERENVSQWISEFPRIKPWPTLLQPTYQQLRHLMTFQQLACKVQPHNINTNVSNSFWGCPIKHCNVKYLENTHLACFDDPAVLLNYTKLALAINQIKVVHYNNFYAYSVSKSICYSMQSRHLLGDLHVHDTTMSHTIVHAVSNSVYHKS